MKNTDAVCKIKIFTFYTPLEKPSLSPHARNLKLIFLVLHALLCFVVFAAVNGCWIFNVFLEYQR